MPKPKAVLISDIHYSLPTLAPADAAIRMAITKANHLGVPLIVAGDLHDTKANLRGECMNAMLKTFSVARMAYILVGNHDKINEKSEDHSLNFLASDKVFIIDTMQFEPVLDLHLIPYQHDLINLRAYLINVDKNSTIIMHQGLESSNAGHYIQDKSAIQPQDVADFRVISGHYHTRQDIKVGRPQKGAVGLFSYIGNPYTLNYAEANDPPKGFQILMDDGTLEFVPTNLREHRVLTMGWSEEYPDVFWPNIMKIKDTDLVWIKVKGPREKLSIVTKEWLRKQTTIPGAFRLDLIPLDSKTEAPAKPTTQPDLLDRLIESITNASDEQKTRLKELWKNLA